MKPVIFNYTSRLFLLFICSSSKAGSILPSYWIEASKADFSRSYRMHDNHLLCVTYDLKMNKWLPGWVENEIYMPVCRISVGNQTETRESFYLIENRSVRLVIQTALIPSIHTEALSTSKGQLCAIEDQPENHLLPGVVNATTTECEAFGESSASYKIFQPETSQLEPLIQPLMLLGSVLLCGPCFILGAGLIRALFFPDSF